ncbi:hypothetical protein E2C01_000723 [Portunus trituberculatus]|uniref:Uncharacterized protein n=1 Tax=Portunus trituberculatus TaxID=210409 RepID=A0A5B7CFE5_PORTR|nr:hypothetical protein [Portunus trituberculatus]
MAPKLRKLLLHFLQVIKDSFIYAAIWSYSYRCFLFQLAPVGSPMRMSWEKMVGKDPIKNLPYNNDDALASVLQGKYAFFANKEYIIYRLQRKLPVQQAMDIVDTKTDFLRRGIGFGLQKHSPYKKLFNHVYVSMLFVIHVLILN